MALAPCLHEQSGTERHLVIMCSLRLSGRLRLSLRALGASEANQAIAPYAAADVRGGPLRPPGRAS
jgi:hypothetical protein